MRLTLFQQGNPPSKTKIKSSDKMKNRKLYAIALFGKMQGTTYRICSLNPWFSTTIKREAEAFARKTAREEGYTGDPKFVAVETLA